jgi:Predicted flavoprotein
MTLPKIGVILSSTRPNRFADKPAAWIMDLAARRGDLALELVDLRDYPLAFFDAPMSPAHAPIEDEVAQRWSRRISGLDGYIFIVAEYNHSIPAALKNALDYTYQEFARKPAAYVGYGGVGAARAIEQLRLISVEQQLAPTRAGVHIGMEPFLGILQQGKTLDDFDYLVNSANAMLDDLAWWTNALKAGREAVEITKAA